MKELLDLEVMVQIRKAAPRVTAVPFDVAQLAVNGMNEYSRSEMPSTDENEVVFWETTVGKLHTFCKFDERVISLNLLGRTLKAMGLESWRKTDGFHIAWSTGQLHILNRHFLK